MKYSDFIDGKYFLRNKRLKGPHFSKKIASSEKFCWYFLLKFPVSVFIDIINMPEKFQKNCLSRSPLVERPPKFSCEIVLEYQKEIALR